MYVPFWFFDGSVNADISFAATRNHVFLQGDYRIIQTKHYNVRRAGNVPFEKIPVDASRKMPDDYMDSIEPFDYTELKPFSTAYLPGYLADKYDVSAEECAGRADVRAKNTAEELMSSDVTGYATCSIRKKQLSLRRGKVSYGLLPVYLLSTRWNDQNYLFAMNGQTGKMIGDLPVDKKKYWSWFGKIAGSVTAILGTLAWFFIG